MRIIRNNYLPPLRKMRCMNLFGVLFVRNGFEPSVFDINHETIHSEQMKELWYIGFYLIYCLEYVYRLSGCVVDWARGSLNRSVWYSAYRRISFEVEARKYAMNLTYPVARPRFAQWRTIKMDY